VKGISLQILKQQLPRTFHSSLNPASSCLAKCTQQWLPNTLLAASLTRHLVLVNMYEYIDSDSSENKRKNLLIYSVLNSVTRFYLIYSPYSIEKSDYCANFKVGHITFIPTIRTSSVFASHVCLGTTAVPNSLSDKC
jgi:hypothetical protein